MVHRHTPLASAFRAYTAGGSRAMIDKIDDNKLMQEPNDTQGMRGESWPKMEAPQNYGFTSVVADAMKGANGMIKQCAEGFIGFMGGNRSFPVLGVMDDRRHRLKNLANDAAKGATAMFGLKEWGQQFLNCDKGMFMTGNTEKKMRFQLVENQNGKKQQQQSGGGGGTQAGLLEPIRFRSESGVEFEIEVLPRAEGGSGGNGGGDGQSGAQGSKPTGQKTLHKEKSETYVDMTKEQVHTVRGNGNILATDAKSTSYHGNETKSTRADGKHSHIRTSGNRIWVDNGGCFSTKPIIVADDPHDEDSTPAESPTT